MIDNQFFTGGMNAGMVDNRQNFQTEGLPSQNYTPQQQSYTSQPFQVSSSQVLSSAHPLESSATASSTARQAINGRRPRPVTMHGSDLTGFNYLQAQAAYAPWNAPANMVPTRNGVNSQTFAVNQAIYETMGGLGNRPTSMHLEQTYQKLNGTWNPGCYIGGMEMNGTGLANNAGVPFASAAGPFEDFEATAMASDHGLDGQYSNKRISGSSFTMSTTGVPSDIGCSDDYSASPSVAQSFILDYPAQSNRTSLLSSIHSPITSPRMSGLHRMNSRGKASPTSKQSMRSTPYSTDGRNKRWSTGSYASTSRRVPSPFVLAPSVPEGFVHNPPQPTSPFEPPGPYNHFQPLNMANLQGQQYPYTPNSLARTTNMVLPSNDFEERTFDNQAPRQMPHSLFRMLHSNAEPADHAHAHYETHSDRPDLRAALDEEQLPPPPEDMNPSDPNLIPREQELRFDTDLYTPRWIRGHGKEREGWCGICKPGKWLVLKTSAFWYDKSFMHGISAPTGKPFQEPREMRRSETNPELWEGNCGGCGEWVAMTSHKKKGTTWFRHAYRVTNNLQEDESIKANELKCHTHNKVKDPTKKKRTSLEKGLPASRSEKQQDKGTHNSISRSSGSLNRKMLASTPEDYNMM